jgi:type II secretory pathway component PulF
MPHSPQLDYEVHRVRRPSPIHFIPQAAIWAAIAFTLTGLVMYLGPRYEEVFRGMQVKLPPLTVLLFRFLDWMRMGGLVVVWVLPVAIPFVLWRIVPADENGRPQARPMLAVRIITLGMLLLALLVGFYALIAPWLVLITPVD